MFKKKKPQQHWSLWEGEVWIVTHAEGRGLEETQGEDSHPHAQERTGTGPSFTVLKGIHSADTLTVDVQPPEL